MWNLRLTSFRAGGKSLNIFATRLSRFFSFSRPHRVAGLGRLRARSALFFHRINGSSFVKLRCCDGGFAKPGETSSTPCTRAQPVAHSNQPLVPLLSPLVCRHM